MTGKVNRPRQARRKRAFFKRRGEKQSHRRSTFVAPAIQVNSDEAWFMALLQRMFPLRRHGTGASS